MSDDAQTTGQPLAAMGGFDHEAVEVAPGTGAVHLTEDDRNQAGRYEFVPADTSGRPGALTQGGTLHHDQDRGRRFADFLNPAIGDSHTVGWVKIAAAPTTLYRVPP